MLLKNAGYRGHTNVWGTPDGGSKTKFYAGCYFTYGDSWNSLHKFKEYNIDIKLNGYIEIELTRRVSYDKVYELIIFMQLLYPNKFDISEINVMVDDKYYGLFLPLKTIDYENKFNEPSVKDDILVFLEKCYNSIPYRNSKTK